MNELDKSARKSLLNSGWYHLRLLDSIVTPDMLHRIGGIFGKIVSSQATEAVDNLLPRIDNFHSMRSLSGKFGLGEFPLHNDTAHWTVPARVVVLGCIESSTRDIPTYLCDTQKIKLSKQDRQLAESSVFYVHNGRFSFYASILSSNRPYIRCDPGCMEAEDENASRAIELFSRQNLVRFCDEVVLKAGEILIIDNWRTLHGRGSVSSQDMARKLLRVYVV